MLSNPMLDVAIGLILLYLMLSIIVTASQEYISALIQQRGKNLVKAIEELVGIQNKAAFFQHPLIYPLFQDGVDGPDETPKKLPTYIPSRNFALAVLDLQGRKKAKTDPGSNRLPSAFALADFFGDAASAVGLSSRMQKIEVAAKSLADKIGNETIRKAATDALTAAAGELKTATDVVDTAVKELENLFNSTMDRAAGWYKRWTQWVGLGLGLIIALILNADTIYVAKRLAADDTLRARAVALAEAYTSPEGQQQWEYACTAIAGASAKIASSPPSTADNSAAGGIDKAQEVSVPPAPAQATPAIADQVQVMPQPAPATTEDENLSCAANKFNTAMNNLAAADYPIGWTKRTDQTGFWWWLPKLQPEQSPLLAPFGILFTGLALSLGASFWFDLLGKFMNVRMAGKRESTTTPSAASAESQ